MSRICQYFVIEMLCLQDMNTIYSVCQKTKQNKTKQNKTKTKNKKNKKTKKQKTATIFTILHPEKLA